MTTKKIIWTSLLIAVAALLVAALGLGKTPKAKASRLNVNKNVVQKL